MNFEGQYSITKSDFKSKYLLNDPYFSGIA